MSPQPITSIAIIGGDISAWAAAAWLANTLKGTSVKITLLELPDMVNAEPMQHTVPETLQYFEPLGIDAAELVRKTGATYKLGIGLHDIASDNDHRVLAFHEAAVSVRNCSQEWMPAPRQFQGHQRR